MRYLLFPITIFIICITVSCTKDKKEANLFPTDEVKQIESIPFTSIDLIDMSAFKPVSKNWNIVANVVAAAWVHQILFYPTRLLVSLRGHVCGLLLARHGRLHARLQDVQLLRVDLSTDILPASNEFRIDRIANAGDRCWNLHRYAVDSHLRMNGDT